MKPNETAERLSWPDRRWWLRGVPAFAALLSPPPFRRLRRGARLRSLGQDAPTKANRQAGRA